MANNKLKKKPSSKSKKAKTKRGPLACCRKKKQFPAEPVRTKKGAKSKKSVSKSGAKSGTQKKKRHRSKTHRGEKKSPKSKKSEKELATAKSGKTVRKQPEPVAQSKTGSVELVKDRKASPTTAKAAATPDPTTTPKSDEAMQTQPTTEPISTDQTLTTPPIKRSREKAEPNEEEKKEDLAKKSEGLAPPEEPFVQEVQYPSQKFVMSQFVENKCQVRRWVYEESVPLAMNSNMKFILKSARDQIAACRNEKQKRDDFYKDLARLSELTGQ